MNSYKRTTRLGVLVAGSAALFAFGMSAPAMAQQPGIGTVGNVTKIPPGQAADGSDSNRGWQCDGNKGAGDGNPAHAYNCGDNSSDVGGTTSSSVVLTSNVG